MSRSAGRPVTITGPLTQAALTEERALIERARGGDRDAFEALVRAHQSLAHSLAYRILGGSGLPADAVQTALLAAYRSLAAYRGGSFKAWLLRIVANACYNQLRARSRRPLSYLEDLAEDPEHSRALADRRAGPEEAVIRQELARAVEGAIARLPWAQRLVLVLADVEGFSYKEIAEITGASLGTVRSRLHRARRKLRDDLVCQRLVETGSSPARREVPASGPASRQERARRSGGREEVGRWAGRNSTSLRTM